MVILKLSENGFSVQYVVLFMENQVEFIQMNKMVLHLFYIAASLFQIVYVLWSLV